MLFTVLTHIFVGNLFSKLHNHLSADEFKHLVNPERSLGALQSLEAYDFVHNFSIFHHFDLKHKLETGKFYLRLLLWCNLGECQELFQTKCTQGFLNRTLKGLYELPEGLGHFCYPLFRWILSRTSSRGTRL